jgi:hypothetical protein
VEIAAGIVFFEGCGANGTPLISTFAPEGVLVMRSFSACAALVKKAKEMSAIVLRPLPRGSSGFLFGQIPAFVA